MEGTRDTATTLTVTDRYGRQADSTLTREEWLELQVDETVNVVRYHRDLVGQAA